MITHNGFGNSWGRSQRTLQEIARQKSDSHFIQYIKWPVHLHSWFEFISSISNGWQEKDIVPMNRRAIAFGNFLSKTKEIRFSERLKTLFVYRF